MGFLSNTFPNLPGWEPFECSHEWVSDNYGYAGIQHVMIVAYGGKPGYVACPADLTPSKLREWVREAFAAGYTKVSVETCGYGGKPNSYLIRKASKVIAECKGKE